MQKTPASLRLPMWRRGSCGAGCGKFGPGWGAAPPPPLSRNFQTRTDQRTRRGCHKPRRCTKSPAQTRRTPPSPGLGENGKGRRLVCPQYSSLKQQPLFISYKYCAPPPPRGRMECVPMGQNVNACVKERQRLNPTPVYY